MSKYTFGQFELDLRDDSAQISYTDLNGNDHFFWINSVEDAMALNDLAHLIYAKVAFKNAPPQFPELKFPPINPVAHPPDTLFNSILAELETKRRKVWEVWCEGYSATGDHAPCHMVGSVAAASFEEACDKLCLSKADYDPVKRTLWGCSLFPTKHAAAKSFG